MTATLRLTVRTHPDGAAEWRLLARNGRPLGVSRQRYPTPEDARHAFVTLCAQHAQLSRHFHHSRTATAWTWSVNDGQGVVAGGSRTYARRGTCGSACARFLAALTTLAAHPVAVAVAVEHDVM